MNAERILAETFAEHERLAPDADDTWAGIADRLERRRSPGRALAVAASAAAVAVLAVGGTVLLRDPAPSPGGIPPAAARTSAAPALPTISIGAGRLPAGAVEELAEVGDGENRVYRVGEMTVGLSHTPRKGALPADNKRGTPRDLTVAGRPAREWSVEGWYTLAFLAPGGGLATVELASDGAPAAGLAATGRRIGGSMRFDRQDPVRIGYVLGDVPPDLTQRSVTWRASGGTTYTLERRQDPGAVAVTVEDQDGTWATSALSAKGGRDAVAGRPVGGHRTWVLRDPASTALWVDSGLGDRSVLLYGTSLEELYRIAGGIRTT